MSEKEPNYIQISVSQPVENALLTCGRDLNGKPLGVPQLLLAVLSQDGLGKRSMEVVSKGVVSIANLSNALRNSQEEVEDVKKIVINGQELLVTGRATSLLEEAGRQAKGSLCVDTGHILQAELNSMDNLLGDLLDPRHISAAPINKVLSNFIDIARKEHQYPQEPVATYSVQAEPIAGDDKRIIDLIDSAKSGKYKGVFVNPEWTLALIQSVTSSPVTIIMTDHEEEVSMALQGLAVELSSHESSYTDIPKIIVPDSSSLVEDPDGIIAAAVREAEGGVLVLPDDPRFLTHKGVRMALERKKIRVISFADEHSWAKSKGTLGQINARELYLSSPNEATLLTILKTQKQSLEALYGNNGGKNKTEISISDDAFRVSAKLGYRYASVMDVSSILAARKLLETAATNLKLTHSGMGQLLPYAIPDDMTIDVDDVYLALKTITGIEMQPEDPSRFLRMESELKKQIIGQDEAIDIVSDTVRRSETVLRDPRRPRGVFMFLGPSGVGKTELAKALNEFIFHDERSFIQLNMSEYQEQHAVARLIGSPPGYVGYEEGGQLTEKVRKQPYSIVVVDEMEKANAKVFDVFLQVFEEGTLTDGRGRTVDFSNTIIILTGNIGSEYFSDIDSRGFPNIKDDVLREAREVYRPEFLNRVDNIIVFKPLSPEAISQIVDLQVQKINSRLVDSNIKVQLTAEMHKYLEKVGYDPKYGARPLRRAVETYVGNKLTPKLLSKSFGAGDVVLVDYQDGKVVFSQGK